MRLPSSVFGNPAGIRIASRVSLLFSFLLSLFLDIHFVIARILLRCVWVLLAPVHIDWAATVIRFNASARARRVALTTTVFLPLWSHLFLAVLAFSEQSAIYAYDVTMVAVTPTEASGEGARWYEYVSNVCEGGRKSNASLHDNPLAFDPIEIQTPFFSMQRVSWYVSSNGFLSVTESPMCSGFCSHSGSPSPTGSYTVRSERDPSDWPTASLFATDLDPTRSISGSICVSPLTALPSSSDSDSDEPVWLQTVTYNGVALHANVEESEENRTLDAQVSLFSNGTLIFRYRAIPTATFSSPERVSTYASLRLSGDEFVSVPLPASVALPAALRFEPVFDDCALRGISSLSGVATSLRDACVQLKTCSWCETTGRCFLKKRISSLCPSLQFTADSSVAQRHYSVAVGHGAAFVQELPADAVVYDTPREEMPLTIPLGFTFPFFTRALRFSSLLPNSSAEAQSGRSTTTVTLDHTGTLSLLPGGQTCQHIYDYCWDGEYRFAILPFQTKATLPKSGASITVFSLPNRTKGEALCSHAAGCPEAKVIQVRGLKPSLTTIWGTTTAFREGQTYSFQVYLDASGVVDFVYDRISSAPSLNSCIELCPTHVTLSAPTTTAVAEMDRTDFYVAQPEGIVGLVREGVSDPRSVLVPACFIQQGTQVHFTPVSACVDCSDHGVCDEASGQCVCDVGFDPASSCTECAEGFYGALCQPCPACMNGGVCDWGSAGSGSCRCPPRFWDTLCDKDCTLLNRRLDTGDDRFACPPTRACSPNRGECVCGVCACFPGWTGETCDEALVDPCWAYSLDGCAVCVSKEGCSYCTSGLCVSTTWPNYHSDSQCSGKLISSPNFCSNVVVSNTGGYRGQGQALLSICVSIAAAGIIGSAAWIALLKSYFHVDDARVHVAAGGIPYFCRPTRPRRVAAFATVGPDQVGAQHDFVAGVPLKQISLKALYRRQQQRSRMHDIEAGH